MSPAPKRKTTKPKTPVASSRPSAPQRSVVYIVWRWLRWPLLVLILLYAALVIYRIPAVGDQQKTAEAVAEIQSQHITLGDVMGDNLPFVPYAPNNDATVAGIDTNNNGIRDDVELAIFKLHPDSAKIRAAELQYAMTEQMFLTDVFNTDTWKAVAQEDSKAYLCVSDTLPKTNLDQESQALDGLTKEVQNLVFNTQTRIDAENKAYSFTTSYADLKGVNDCDIDLSSLPN